MTNAILRGKPDAGNPHVRFDEGEVASAKPRRGSLLYSKSLFGAMCAALCAAVAGAEGDAARTAWFREARFGMFIHWGVYSIPAKGEWSYANDKYSPAGNSPPSLCTARVKVIFSPGL